jgi:hypothetical protein
MLLTRPQVDGGNWSGTGSLRATNFRKSSGGRVGLNGLRPSKGPACL